MADGRHFENSFISTSQLWIILFRSNLVHIYKFPFRAWKFYIKSKFFKFKMADRRHIENRFWLYIHWRHILRFMQISEWRWRITCRYRTVDQNDNFQKFKMADGRHFENSFIFISQSELSDFDQIWYADANFHSEDGYLTKIEIFQIQDGGRTPYW